MLKNLLNKAAEVYENELEKAKTQIHLESFGKVETEVIAGNTAIPTGRVKITSSGTPGALNFTGKKVTTVNVSSIGWQHNQDRNLGKAAAGSIIGGVLTGGVGAVLGGALGAKKQDASTAVLVLEDGQQVYIRCSGTDYETLNKMLAMSK